MRLSHFKVLFGSLGLTLAIAGLAWTLSSAGACDGTAADDVIVCNTNTLVGDMVGLGSGDDVFTQNAGVTTSYFVTGDGGGAGTHGAGNGGNDQITINGIVESGVEGDYVTGNGGNDTIIINGSITNGGVAGDDSDGIGGNDVIVVNGYVDNTVYGDASLLDGGDDIIIINGMVNADVHGDNVAGAGGDDSIYVNGTGSVSGGINGDASGAIYGNDTVTLAEGAHVVGTIDGDGGTDILRFNFYYQDELDALGLDPSSSTLTYAGETYTWINFEYLLGLVRELAERGLRVYFASEQLLAAEDDSRAGINVFAQHGRIAYIPFASLETLQAGGEGISFQTANSAGWHVIVFNLGVAEDNPGHSSYLVLIFNAGGGLAGQFNFVN